MAGVLGFTKPYSQDKEERSVKLLVPSRQNQGFVI
jgi:hypothetical protein